jgi:transposase
MPRAYSQDLRDRVRAAAHAGETHLAVAARFAVGESNVRSWLRRERLTGRTTARPYRGSTGRSSLGPGGEALLVTLYAGDNARTLAEVAQALAPRLGHGGSGMSVWRAGERLALRRKKTRMAKPAGDWVWSLRRPGVRSSR